MARSRRKSKTPSDRGAFTLVELLVVIVILGLLMALLVPSLRGVWSRYNMTRCQTNLSHIYQAFRLRTADEAMGVGKAFRVEEWDGVLMSYLENDTSQFRCMEVAEGETNTGIPIEDAVGIRVYGSVVDNIMLLVPGPWVAKLSVTQWNDAGIRDRKLYDVPPYAPDGKPEYYFIMEDWHDVSRSDYDYDISIKVTENDDGTTTLVFKQHGTGATYQVINPDSLEMIKNDSGTPMTKAQMDGGAQGTVTLDTIRPGETDYGMNKYARDVGGAGGKILVMDYSRYVAEPDKPDDWTDKVFDPDQNKVPRFARHFGQANILFSDGSVHPERPEDIDPIAPTTAMKWWEP